MDEFLGAAGAATIVLLKLKGKEKPPSIKNLKRNLEVENIKYYKGDGWYRNGIRMLEQLLRILDAPKDPVSFWFNISCTDFLQLDPDVNQHPFYQVLYTDITIAGFNLTNQCMSDLESLLRIRGDICSMQDSVRSFLNKIEYNIEFAKLNSIDDVSMLDPKLEVLKEMFANYGDDALESINSRLAEWHQKYKWKGRDFEEIAVTDELDSAEINQ
jgi:hypothetical protein